MTKKDIQAAKKASARVISEQPEGAAYNYTTSGRCDYASSGYLYGGEMSAHHYFRDFGRCDSGMLPWLLVCRLLAEKRQPLSALVDAAMRAYPVSGEINTAIEAPAQEVLAAVQSRFPDGSRQYP